MRVMTRKAERLLDALHQLAFDSGHREPSLAVVHALRDLNFGLQRAPTVREVIRYIINKGNSELASQREAEKRRIRDRYEIREKAVRIGRGWIGVWRCFLGSFFKIFK